MNQDIVINDPNSKKETNYPSFLLDQIELNEEEHLVKAVRKHWVIFRDPFLIGFFIPFVLIFITIFFSTPFLKLPEVISDKITYVPLVLAPLFFIVGSIMFLRQLFLWYKTFYIITNQRLIKLEQENLFNSRIHQMYFDKVQDAICRVPGLQAILYGYEDISIQGASETAKIYFKRVSKKNQLQKVIAKEVGKVNRKSSI